MRQARAFAHKELLLHTAEAHRLRRRGHPAGRPPGPLNGGFQVLMDELDTERVTYCTGSLGEARRALEIAAEHSTKRVQFRQPIAMFGGVSFKLAEMYTALVDHAMQVLISPCRPSSGTPLLLRIGAGSDEIMKFLVARETLKEVKG
jgi:alkylation response protein AidB-like acyl-CoA dehydrogenase